MEIWIESAWFNTTNERSTDQARLILQKDWFSDFEILEIWDQVNCEEYEQTPPIRTETLNTEKLEPPTRIETLKNNKSPQPELKEKIQTPTSQNQT